MSKETPIDEHDELMALERVREVFAPDGPFEKAGSPDSSPSPSRLGSRESGAEDPTETYAAVEEVLPELAATEDDVAGDFEDPAGKGFPVDRRDFMRLFGAGSVAAAASGCIRRPVEKSVPHVNQPIDHVPGVATNYATTCTMCSASCGVFAKVREGRPVKLEGNRGHPVSQGGLCALGQASIQGLFHPERLKGPLVRLGSTVSQEKWDDVLPHLASKIGDGSKVAIFAAGSTGSRADFYREFLTKMGSPATNLYQWEPNTQYASVTAAHKLAFGIEGMPRLNLRKANTIIGIGSDFLDVGTSPVYQAKSFAQVHAYRNGRMGKLVQFETTMSLTGARADYRHVIPAGSELTTALLLLRAVHQNPASKGSGDEKAQVQSLLEKHADTLTQEAANLGVSGDVFDSVAAELVKGQGVVLAGGSANFDDKSTTLQLATIMINVLIGAYERSLILDRGPMSSVGGSGDLERFVKDASDLDAVFFIETNPLYDVPVSWGFKEALAKVKKVISIQSFPNETDLLADYRLPNHHMLESWGDAEPVRGFFSSQQPVVRPTTDSRQAEDILLWVAAHAGKSLPFADYRAYLKTKWQRIYDLLGTNVAYDRFYSGFLRRGHIGKLTAQPTTPLADVLSDFKYQAPQGSGFKLVASFDHRFQEGKGSHLPVLHEIGDGMTTVTWDSWVAISPDAARKLGVKRNDVVRVKARDGSAFEAAVFPMPGLHNDTVEVKRGLGHALGLSKVSEGVGVNPLTILPKGADPYTGSPVTCGFHVTLEKTGKRYRLAAMQKHHDLENRKEIVKRINLSVADKSKRKTVNLDKVPDLYPKLPSAKHRWGLAFDLNKCTGCGACMVACAVENNVPQVGRDQINLGREMHWIRLDRYFHGSVENPKVSFQPVTCQHCNHAPCEAVCPVYATTHDAEGVNSMTYNRCVGTRYCANACPYKVRRFNWYTFKWGEMGELKRDRNPRALNPDVTVRTKGVMEKCSFCVGRLRDAKHEAKKQGLSEVRDYSVRVACQETCPSDAIVFGNLNDPRSRISATRSDHRAYLMLGGDPEHGHYGIKTLPNVSYLADVIHDGDKGGSGGHDSIHPGHDHDHDHGGHGHDHG